VRQYGYEEESLNGGCFWRRDKRGQQRREQLWLARRVWLSGLSPDRP